MSGLEELLSWQIIQAKIPYPAREYQFYKPRRWRFDFAWPDKWVAVEVEGGTWINGAHNRGAHFESDCEKYNTATAYGWKVFRFTAKMVKDLSAIEVIKASL